MFGAAPKSSGSTGVVGGVMSAIGSLFTGGKQPATTMDHR